MGMLRETRLCLGLNTCWRWIKTKTDKNIASVFRVFDLLFIQLKPYENEFSTALSECKAVARCDTRKTDTAINRIKTVGAYKTVDTTCKTNTSIIEKTVGDCKIPNGFQ